MIITFDTYDVRRMLSGGRAGRWLLLCVYPQSTQRPKSVFVPKLCAHDTTITHFQQTASNGNGDHFYTRSPRYAQGFSLWQVSTPEKALQPRLDFPHPGTPKGRFSTTLQVLILRRSWRGIFFSTHKQRLPVRRSDPVSLSDL